MPIGENKTASDESHGLIVILMATGIVGLGIMAFVLIRRAVRRRALGKEEFDDWPDDPSVETVGGQPASSPEPISKAREKEVICPKCGRSFPSGARLCPHDKADLSSAAADSEDDASSASASGMICPKCHRGYESDARFCPHDSERLVPYAEWRARNRAGRVYSG